MLEPVMVEPQSAATIVVSTVERGLCVSTQRRDSSEAARAASHPKAAPAKTFYDWISPSLLQDCGLSPQPWHREHALRAAELFTDCHLQDTATVLVLLHPHVLDYIVQAPVMVLAAAFERPVNFRRRADRLALATRFLTKAGPANKLPAILKAYGIAPPLRRLHGELISRRLTHLLPIMSLQPERVLANVIPGDLAAQRDWLEWLDRLVVQHGRARYRGAEILAWCIAELNTPIRREQTVELLDWVHNDTAQFRSQMTFDQVSASSRRWHEEQASRRSVGSLFRGAKSFQTADYEPLPTQWSSEELTFIAITTYRGLDEESARMHHCVRSYWSRVLDGSSRIYSVRRAGLRVATLELCPDSLAAGPPAYRVNQLKGACNARVSADVDRSALSFLAVANAAAARAALLAPGDDLAQEDAQSALGARISA
jgi:hypothetical protein